MSLNDIFHTPSNEPKQDSLDTADALLSFAELNESDKEKKPEIQRRIRPRTLSLIATSAGAVLLAVILLVVMLTGQNTPPTDQPTDDSPTDTPETPAITLLDKSGAEDKDKAVQLQKIVVTNSSGTYSISFDEKEKMYFLQGYEDITLATNLILTLRSHTEIIEATEQIKNDSDLKPYGLDSPQASATMTYGDGTTARLHVGDATPSETGYYGRVEGIEGIYIFESDAVSLFRVNATAFANTTLISAPTPKSDDTNGKALLKEITYTGSAYPNRLRLRRSYYTDSEEFTYFSYIITAPYMRCTTDTVSAALSNFNSLQADQALILHPTAEQKTKLGFDKPLMQVSITLAVETEDADAKADEDGNKPNIYYNAVDYKLTIGSTDENSNYIAMIDGVDAIFLISQSSYGHVLDRTYQNSVSEFLFFRNINLLSRVVVNVKGSVYDFSLTHYPEKEDTDDQMEVTFEDKTYPTEDFRELYQLLMGLERYGESDVPSTGDIPLSIALYDADGKLYLGAEYYNTSGSLCTVQTNEGELFTTRWSDVSFFIQQIENYINGKDVLIST